MLTLAVILRPTSGSTKQHVTVSHALSMLQDTVLPSTGRSVTKEQAKINKNKILNEYDFNKNFKFAIKSTFLKFNSHQ